ncbi:hypothetical protein SAMN05216228_1017122 [Rhizobium tibeticum]|uniref:Uncharacterized protein n=2 Tax=Rhizobium tibeticum TaxID=501024 RepID=A0A1H8PVC3_9HYPH|nr:hypothetical protein RTCCBAU85039_3561 [Rhizobium tibeticum]SEO45711.1 hypothetical protein SAMN05216228_1017122 [Rhizobium tibeticum]
MAGYRLRMKDVGWSIIDKATHTPARLDSVSPSRWRPTMQRIWRPFWSALSAYARTRRAGFLLSSSSDFLRKNCRPVSSGRTSARCPDRSRAFADKAGAEPMDYVTEEEKRLGRPIGRRLGTIKRDDGIYEARVVPAYAGEDRTVVFIRRPTWKEWLLSLARSSTSLRGRHSSWPSNSSNVL